MQSKAVGKVKKPETKCYLFKNIFEYVRHFGPNYAHPVETLEAQGYTLIDENKCFKTFSGSEGGYEYVCVVEMPEQDYVILLRTWREYLTFVRNFAMVPQHLFQRLIPPA